MAKSVLQARAKKPHPAAPTRRSSTALPPVLDRLQKLLPSLRDPYLLDSLREFLRLAAQIENRSGEDGDSQVVRDAFYACEITRDATMRFLPYSAAQEAVLLAAIDAYERVIEKLKSFAVAEVTAKKVLMYANHIEKRSEEYRDAQRNLAAAR